MSIADTIEDTFADRDPATMAAAVVTGVCAALADATDPQTITTRTSGGAIFKAIAWQGKLWSLDPADSTTPHDEITCIRTIDGDGYFTDDVRMPKAVLSRSETTPPDPDDVVPENRPAYGDAYIPAAAATGDWAGHEDEVAVYTSRGWVFKAGAHGDILLVEDEGTTGEFIHFNVDDEWEDGLPGDLIDGSVRPSSLLIRFWAVQNQTTTAPPATGPAGEQYIIGGSATGAWAGQDKKIAWRPVTNAAFVIATPAVGEEVYDKNLGIKVKWTGSVWQSVTGLIVGGTSIFTSAAGSTSPVGSGTYDYSTASAPASTTRRIDGATLAYAAKTVGNKLQFTYQATLTGDADDITVAIGLKRDTDTNALAWDVFIAKLTRYRPVFTWEITAVDTSSHTYFVVFYSNSGNNSVTGFEHRMFSMQERSVG